MIIFEVGPFVNEFVINNCEVAISGFPSRDLCLVGIDAEIQFGDLGLALSSVFLEVIVCLINKLALASVVAVEGIGVGCSELCLGDCEGGNDLIPDGVDCGFPSC